MAVRKGIAAVQIDCKNLRDERQKENNIRMFQLLANPESTQFVTRDSNEFELRRVFADVGLDLQQLLHKCRIDTAFAKVVARTISKRASRQGTKDEAFVLNRLNEGLRPIGIFIENLSTTAYRPTKDGRILTNDGYKRSGLKKNDCLKSFDAKISVKVNGWVFAKIVFSKGGHAGGHQDNVFAEAHEFGLWAQKYGEENQLCVLLIDTDLHSQMQELKDKFHIDNIIVCNHFELQVMFLAHFTPIGNEKQNQKAMDEW